MASDTFVDAAATQAAALGVQVRRVFVAHPIQDRSDEELRALAEGAFASVVGALYAT